MASVKSIIVAQLRAGKTNVEILGSVYKAHPYSKISLATVNWYRNRLRQDGYKIPSERQIRR